MSTEVEDIIKNNDYAQLSAHELELVNEWASSEEEYSTMRQIIASAASLNKDIAPSPKLRASLMETFAAAHATAAPVSTSSSNEKKNTRFTWSRAVVPPARRMAIRRPHRTTSPSDGINVPTSIAAAPLIDLEKQLEHLLGL